MPEDSRPDPVERREEERREDEDKGTLSVGAFGVKIKLTGNLARQTLIALGAGAAVWFIGFSRPQRILEELKLVRGDVLKTQITCQAIVESMPPKQQQMASKIMGEKLAVLKLAEGNH